MIHKLLSLIREIFNSTHRDNCQKGKLQPEFQTTKLQLMLPLKWKVTLKQAKSPAKCMNTVPSGLNQGQLALPFHLLWLKMNSRPEVD